MNILFGLSVEPVFGQDKDPLPAAELDRLASEPPESVRRAMPNEKKRILLVSYDLKYSSGQDYKVLLKHSKERLGGGTI